ncbi:MAG TPA: hypothetical protein VJ023_13200 [Pyrinomonadaceae bacterium]|nr:hypothetical protein [Pyrinomonadaceae bacterium]
MTEAASFDPPESCDSFNRDELFREAEVFHQAIFGRPAPNEICEAFVSANRLLKQADKVTPVRIDLILQRSLDVEAIEFALRRRNPQNLLTKKLLILCYLTESRSAYFTTFVNEQYAPLRGFIKLSFATFRSAYKLLKGQCLIRIYGIA